MKVINQLERLREYTARLRTLGREKGGKYRWSLGAGDEVYVTVCDGLDCSGSKEIVAADLLRGRSLTGWLVAYLSR